MSPSFFNIYQCVKVPCCLNLIMTTVRKKGENLLPGFASSVLNASQSELMTRWSEGFLWLDLYLPKEKQKLGPYRLDFCLPDCNGNSFYSTFFVKSSFLENFMYGSEIFRFFFHSPLPWLGQIHWYKGNEKLQV